MTTPHILSHASVLLVRNVPLSVSYWTEKLGFEATGVWGEPPEFAILRHGEARIMLGQAKTEHVIVPNWQARSGLWNAYFWVDDAKAMFEAMRQRGAIIDYELEIKDYGVLEFGIRDLDDQDVGFGQVL